MKQAYIAFCAYGENKTEQINRAVWAIHAKRSINVMGVSRIYSVKDHDDNYYCGGVKVETVLSPEELFNECVEKSPKGLRIRILRYEDAASDNPHLTLPDPLLETEASLMCILLNFVADKAVKKQLKEIGEDNIRVTGDGLYMPL